MIKTAFDFTRSMFTIAKYNEGLYDSASQGRTALKYAQDNNDFPQESEAWARRIPGYNRKEMRSIALVNNKYRRVYYFLLDRAGVVAWSKSRLRNDGVLPKPTKQDYIRPELTLDTPHQDIDLDTVDTGPVMGKVVQGVYEVEGKVLSVKARDGQDHCLLEVIKDKVMFKLWGPVPMTFPNGMKKGDKVKFKAEVSRSDRDPEFGFYTPLYKKEDEVGQAPEGLHNFEGIIKSTFIQDSQWGTSYKMSIMGEDVRGNPVMVEGTIPADIYRRYDLSDLEGKHVSFQANFTRFRKDPSRAYFKRPKGVSVDAPLNNMASGRDSLTPDVMEALSWIVTDLNEFTDHLENSFEDGGVLVDRHPGKFQVYWDSDYDPFLYPSKSVGLALKGEVTDKTFYMYVQDLYDNKVIYKSDLKALLNFQSFYKRPSTRNFEFEDRQGKSHKISLSVVSYPSYTVKVSYDDEKKPRLFELASLT